MTDAESTYLQMRLVYDQFAKDHFNSLPPLQGKGLEKAIHCIQSFSSDDNIIPEQAHKIAKAFVRRISDGMCLAFGLKTNPNLTGKANQ